MAWRSDCGLVFSCVSARIRVRIACAGTKGHPDVVIDGAGGEGGGEGAYILRSTIGVKLGEQKGEAGGRHDGKRGEREEKSEQGKMARRGVAREPSPCSKL